MVCGQINLENIGKQRWRLEVCLLDSFLQWVIFNRLFFLFQNFAQISLTGSWVFSLNPTILSPQSSKWNIFKMLMSLGHSAQNASIHFLFIFIFFSSNITNKSLLELCVFFPGSRLTPSPCSLMLLNMTRYFLSERSYIFKYHFLR